MIRFIYILQLCHEDTDIHDPACKCLSLLVQLFGGEHKEALNPENMVKFVKVADPNFFLRILC